MTKAMGEWRVVGEYGKLVAAMDFGMVDAKGRALGGEASVHTDGTLYTHPTRNGKRFGAHSHARNLHFGTPAEAMAAAHGELTKMAARYAAKAAK